jgi:hypothetical protein
MENGRFKIKPQAVVRGMLKCLPPSGGDLPHNSRHQSTCGETELFTAGRGRDGQFRHL